MERIEEIFTNNFITCYTAYSSTESDTIKAGMRERCNSIALMFSEWLECPYIEALNILHERYRLSSNRNNTSMEDIE